jgi:hypothetical protein
MGACPHDRGSVSDGVCEICGTRVDEQARPGHARPFAPLNASREPARPAPRRDPLASLFGPEPGSARRPEPTEAPARHGRAPRPPLDLSATTPDLYRISPPTRPERALSSPPPPAPAHAPQPAPVPPAAAVAPSAPPGPPAPKPDVTAWSVLVACDRVYYMMRLADERFTPTLEFPADQSERRIPLVGEEMRIGRRSAGRPTDPEIDLAGPPADPGISRLHARLVRKPDGTWALVDAGSANGTLLNGQHVPSGEPVALREGDRMHLGAWTVIVLLRG